MVVLIKEAGIPPWGGRLVLQLQNILNGFGVRLNNITPDGQFIAFVGSGPILFQGAGFIHWNG